MRSAYTTPNLRKGWRGEGVGSTQLVIYVLSVYVYNLHEQVHRQGRRRSSSNRDRVAIVQTMMHENQHVKGTCGTIVVAT